jgi:XTP/dITP diphosphohydrolase
MRQKTILIATHNAGKLAEFASLLAPLGYTVISAGEKNLPEPAETGTRFAQNAQLKAIAAARATNLPAIADDSGLCVAALANAPGIYSARYAAGDYPAAFQKIIAAATAANDFRARFVAAICLAQPDGSTATYIGQADGLIAPTPAGTGGFGYDSIFIPLGHDKTYAELGPTLKDSISHRARAFAQLTASLSP